MKRLQLLGKTKYFNLSGSHSQSMHDHRSTHDKLFTNRQVPTIDTQMFIHTDDNKGLLALPDKILLLILKQLDTNTLLQLCALHSKLYRIVTNHLLFDNVVLSDKLSLLQFNALIHSEFRTANLLSYNAKLNGINERDINVDSKIARFQVKSVEFINPQCQDSLLKYSKFYNKQDSSSVIGGTYNLNSIVSSPKHKSNNSSNNNTNNTTNTTNTTNSNNTDNKISDNNLSNTKLNYHHNSNVNKYLKDLQHWENKYAYYTYIELMLDIIDYLPNIYHIKLTNIENNFKIPLWYSVFNDGSKDFMKKILKGQQSITNNELRTFEISDKFIKDYERKFYSLQRIKKLELTGATDTKNKKNSNLPVVPLRSNLLCCFGIINELVINSMIIDTASLDTPMEFLPLHLRKQDRTFNLHSTYQSLTLQNCHIIPGNGILKLFQQYFKDVKRLQLLKINSKYDLLVSNCFSSLVDLTIDCNSNCFINKICVNDDYYYEQSQQQLNNALVMSDNSSIAETLLDDPTEQKLQSPPPTSLVVMSLNLNYIKRTITDLKKNTRKPSIITIDQNNFFKQLRIPTFHSSYHYFKNIWDKLPHKFVNINIINIPFTNVYPLSPTHYIENLINRLNNSDQETLIAYRDNISDTNNNGNHDNANDNILEDNDYYWDEPIKKCIRDNLTILKRKKPAFHDLDINETINEITTNLINNYQDYKNFKDIPNLNLYCFLHSLSKFKSVRIQMLRRKKDCTARNRYDWELLFKPVLNVNVPIEVTDRDGVLLYSYGKRYQWS